mmetsp:Transcript_28363/g.80066  ORF Transcript_28363/g.80066 Transcript_28363/m.80066 type:complete len:191 (-) Transcript_28363:1117-1689(-)
MASACASFRLVAAAHTAPSAAPSQRILLSSLSTAPSAGPRRWGSRPNSKPILGSGREASSWTQVSTTLKAVEESVEAPPHPITLSDTALKHILKMRNDSEGDNLCLRIGVKQGGCSGLSYHMDFEEDSNISSDDMVMEYDDGFKLVCDPKSLLYLFGMQLDYSNELIGGGFQFHNPNAENSCGCGKSFAA